MSLYDYKCSLKIAIDDPPFYALIMAAIRKADTNNMALLERAWPETVAEFESRYWAPGGLLHGETQPQEDSADELRAGR